MHGSEPFGSGVLRKLFLRPYVRIGTWNQRGLRLELKEGYVFAETPSICGAPDCARLTYFQQREQQREKAPCTERMASMRVVAGCARALRNPKVMWPWFREVAVVLCSSSPRLPYCRGTAFALLLLGLHLPRGCRSVLLVTEDSSRRGG